MTVSGITTDTLAFYLYSYNMCRYYGRIVQQPILTGNKLKQTEAISQNEILRLTLFNGNTCNKDCRFYFAVVER